MPVTTSNRHILNLRKSYGFRGRERLTILVIFSIFVLLSLKSHRWHRFVQIILCHEPLARRRQLNELPPQRVALFGGTLAQIRKSVQSVEKKNTDGTGSGKEHDTFLFHSINLDDNGGGETYMTHMLRLFNSREGIEKCLVVDAVAH